MYLVVRWLITAVALVVAAWLVPGIRVEDQNAWIAVAVMALILGLVNAFVRPVLTLLSCPLVLLTLGLFLLVINAAMLGLVAALFDGFRIAGFGSAVLGSIIISITGWLASWFIVPRGRAEVLVNRGP